MQNNIFIKTTDTIDIEDYTKVYQTKYSSYHILNEIWLPFVDKVQMLSGTEFKTLIKSCHLETLKTFREVIPKSGKEFYLLLLLIAGDLKVTDLLTYLDTLVTCDSILNTALCRVNEVLRGTHVINTIDKKLDGLRDKISVLESEKSELQEELKHQKEQNENMQQELNQLKTEVERYRYLDKEISTPTGLDYKQLPSLKKYPDFKDMMLDTESELVKIKLSENLSIRVPANLNTNYVSFVQKNYLEILEFTAIKLIHLVKPYVAYIKSKNSKRSDK